MDTGFIRAGPRDATPVHTSRLKPACTGLKRSQGSTLEAGDNGAQVTDQSLRRLILTRESGTRGSYTKRGMTIGGAPKYIFRLRQCLVITAQEEICELVVRYYRLLGFGHLSTEPAAVAIGGNGRGNRVTLVTESDFSLVY